MRKCTNSFLPDGYKLTDDTGNTIAVLENGEFRLWQAGSWNRKMTMKAERERPKPRHMPSTRALARKHAERREGHSGCEQ